MPSNPLAPNPDPATSARTGLRVLGLDPGATTGWALLVCPKGERARYVAGGTVRADALHAAGAGLFDLLGVDVEAADLVAVEVVAGFAYGRALERVGGLVHASRFAGILIGAARMLGAETWEGTARDIRRELGANLNAKGDAEVKRTLRRWIDLPRCNAHVRDAAAAALVGARESRRRRAAATQGLGGAAGARAACSESLER